MSKLLHEPRDEALDSVGAMLDRYEHEHPGSYADYYRRNDVSIRLRIIDPAFTSLDRVDRHEIVEDYLRRYLPEEIAEDITLMVLLPPAETKSLMNQEYENPIPSLL